jgi:hypothetical protein
MAHRPIQQGLLKPSLALRHKIIPKFEIERFLKETIRPNQAAAVRVIDRILEFHNSFPKCQIILTSQTAAIRTGIRDKNYKSNQANLRSYFLLRLDVRRNRFQTNTKICCSG